jgi:NTE family protein
MKYVKLLDGGLVDNFGLSGLSIAMLAAQHPHDPMTEERAARVRRMLFLVVDAGRGLSGDWANRLEGPSGAELVVATADTAIDASVRSSYAAFSVLVNEWAAKVRRWRCGVSAAERVRLGLAASWKCNDFVAFVDRIGFDRLGGARAGLLEGVPTRLTLPSQQVDMLIEGGGDALRTSAAYQSFRRGL